MDASYPICPPRRHNFYRNDRTISIKLQKCQKVPKIYEDASQSRGVIDLVEVKRNRKNKINFQEKDGERRLFEF